MPPTCESTVQTLYLFWTILASLHWNGYILIQLLAHVSAPSLKYKPDPVLWFVRDQPRGVSSTLFYRVQFSELCQQTRICSFYFICTLVCFYSWPPVCNWGLFGKPTICLRMSKGLVGLSRTTVFSLNEQHVELTLTLTPCGKEAMCTFALLFSFPWPQEHMCKIFPVNFKLKGHSNVLLGIRRFSV